ncbi:MAG: uroporphyrinogen-III C-methyltransferase, partial [Gammaproteobacteria bacterium]
MAEVSEQIEMDSAVSKKSPRSRSGFWFGVIIILIVIGIAGAGYYLLMQLRDRQTNLGGEVKGELSKKIADYQSQLTAIQSQLSTIEATIAGKDTQIQTLQTENEGLKFFERDAPGVEMHRYCFQVETPAN